MKKILISLFLIGSIIVGCHSKQTNQSSQQNLKLSNLADSESQTYVKTQLLHSISEDNVNRFMEQVDLFNQEVKNQGLNQGFETVKEKEYPSYEASYQDLSDPPMTNCRLNSYLLLEDQIEILTKDSDTELLFLDRESIDSKKVLLDEEKDGFYYLFSRVKTQPTKDVKIHGERMKAHFSGVQFDEKARMLSVIMHDNLDGDYLFIGHVGVLVEADEGYLFVEKLAFDEPYQAIQFKTKEEAYQYLLDKYAIDYNQPTAQSFIMDNDEVVNYR